MNRIFLVAASIAMAGCSTVPLTSIPKLMRIDARTTDLSALRVAVQLPKMIRPREGGVMLDVAVETDGRSTKAAFPLEEIKNTEELGLLPAAPASSRLHALTLSPAELTRLEDFRKETAALAAQGKSTELLLSVAARNFCLTGEPAKHPLLATIYLKTSETGSYVPVIRNTDLMADKEIAAELARVRPCSSISASETAGQPR